MNYYLIRIIDTHHHIHLCNKTFSQVVEMLKGLDRETTDGFWNKKETILTSGESVYFARRGE